MWPRMNSSGDILMCVVPSRQALFSCNTTSPAPLRLSRSLAIGRAGDIAAQAFEFLALMRATAYPGMQAEAVRISAQGHRISFVPARYGSQAQHLLSRARPQRDAIGAGGGLQGRERVIGIDVGHVGHALLFDQIAQPGQQFHEARNDLVE